MEDQDRLDLMHIPQGAKYLLSHDQSRKIVIFKPKISEKTLAPFGQFPGITHIKMEKPRTVELESHKLAIISLLFLLSIFLVSGVSKENIDLYFDVTEASSAFRSDRLHSSLTLMKQW